MLIPFFYFQIRFMKKSGMNTVLMNEYNGKTIKSMVETRWNTVYDMVFSLFSQYNVVVNLLLARNKLDKIRSIVKDDLEKICNFLEFFKIKTNVLQGESDINYHLVWQIMDEITKHIQTLSSDSEMIKCMKRAGTLYIQEEIRSNILQPNMLQKLAVFLHPQMKSLRKLNEIEKKEIHAFAKSFIIKENRENTTDIVQAAPLNYVPGRITSRKSSFFDFYNTVIDTNEQNDVDINVIEIEKYLALKSCNEENFNLGEWWLKNKCQFPNLYEIFFRIQSITATSAASERAFSKCRHILNDLRSRTDPQFVNDLMVLTDFVKQKKK